ncbi:MAG: hypothetical protein ACOH1T_01850 [Microbacteriaceae bacterium]
MACGVLAAAPTTAAGPAPTRASMRTRTPPTRRHKNRGSNRLVVVSLVVGIVAVVVLIVTVLALGTLGLV